MIFPGERYDLRIRTRSTPTRKTYRFVIRTEERFGERHFYGLANLEYQDATEFQKGDDDNEEEEEDFTQTTECVESPDNKCLILNCGFSAESSNFRCLSAHLLESSGGGGNGDTSEKHNLVAKKIRTSGFEVSERVQRSTYLIFTFSKEHFISVGVTSKVDGYAFENPHESLHYSSLRKQASLRDFLCSTRGRCDRSARLLTGRPCKCFYFKRFELGNIVQVFIF